MESERAWSRWYLSLSLKQSMPGILGGFTINPLSKACCHRCPGGTKITVIISVQDSKEGRKWGGGGWRGTVRRGQEQESGNQGTSKAATQDPSLAPWIYLPLSTLGTASPLSLIEKYSQACMCATSPWEL